MLTHNLLEYFFSRIINKKNIKKLIKNVGALIYIKFFEPRIDTLI
jgi:hypothetical protein